MTGGAHRQSIFGFGPNAAVATALDERVRRGLAASLSEIADAIGDAIGFTAAAAKPITEAIRQGPVKPAVFGLYTDLVVAAFNEQTFRAATLARQLVALHDYQNADLRIVNLSDRALGKAQAARYRRFLNDGDLELSRVDPVNAAEQRRAEALIAEALALLDQAVPEVGAELRVLLREIVLVHCAAAPDDTEALILDGASTFYLWGAIFLNSARQRNRVSMALALTHEAAHGLLFGMSLGAPLVENDPAERFPSPLRYDPRPMDGLVHATYVLARMIDCLERLLGSGALRPEERAPARDTLDRHRADFGAGLAVVETSARFTAAGAAAFAAMRRAMRPAAALV